MPTTYSDADYTTSGSTGTYTITVGAATGTTTTTANYPCYYTVERYVVDLPKKWKKKDCLAFVKLLNTDTHTGFKVTMFITGDVLLIDPTIHKRSLAEFVPLLKAFANDKDRKLIDDFLKKRVK